MFIKRIKFNNYRNLEDCEIDFSDGINLIYGRNAQGKTNVLESAFLCSTGRSHRTRLEKELIRFDEKFASVKVFYDKRGLENNINVYINCNEKKGIAVNGRPIKRIGELFGRLQTVIFSPEDLSVINGSPADRRRFMDIQICQMDEIYYYHLHTYYKVLKQRNSLLKKKGENNIKDTVSVWDSQLVTHGKQIIKIRNDFINSLGASATVIHNELTCSRERLLAEYRPCVAAEDFERRLNKNFEKDVMYGSTSIGPHKDDALFFVNGRDSKIFGSQGQKRTVMLSLRLAEIEILKNETNDAPVLLLDDALSELDGLRQQMLAEYCGGIQTFITATGMEDLIVKLKGNVRVFNIEEGKMTKKY